MKNPILARDDIKATEPKGDMVTDRRHSFLKLGLSALQWDRHVKTSPLFKIT